MPRILVQLRLPQAATETDWLEDKVCEAAEAVAQGYCALQDRKGLPKCRSTHWFLGTVGRVGKVTLTIGVGFHISVRGWHWVRGLETS